MAFKYRHFHIGASLIIVVENYSSKSQVLHISNIGFQYELQTVSITSLRSFSSPFSLFRNLFSCRCQMLPEFWLILSHFCVIKSDCTGQLPSRDILHLAHSKYCTFIKTATSVWLRLWIQHYSTIMCFGKTLMETLSVHLYRRCDLKYKAINLLKI